MPRELSARAIGLGLLLSIVMGAANVYLGLRVGMTVSASIPAAVIGILLLRVVFRHGTILEANQIQTAASAGESLAAGVIFTLPALVLVGAWDDFNWWLTTGIAISGGLLGVLFMIPMRRVFIIDNKELAFPEGIACAEVLRAAESGKNHTTNATPIFLGTLIGAGFKFFTSYIELISHSIQLAFVSTSQRVFYFGADISPALVGVGFIVKWRIAVLIFFGGSFAWLLCIPMLGTHSLDMSAIDTAWQIWDSRIRYMGVGAMLVAGFDSIVRVRGGLKAAFFHIQARFSEDKANAEHAEDISSKTIFILAALIVVLIAVIYYQFTQNILVTALATLLMFVLSFFFTAVASYIVGLVGSSNSPVSGMTITAVLISGLFILATASFTEVSGIKAMTAMLGIAGVVCCVACTSGDVCNDLKTGQLVGASPKLQQRMQIAGVIVGALVMAPVLKLLHEHTPGGIGGRELAAPQATLFANLAKGFFLGQKLPWDMVGMGIGSGLLVLALDTFLQRRDQSYFRLHLMPIAVGIYLPFGVTVPMLIGSWLAHVAGHDKIAEHKGVLMSSGMIAGEALMGICIAGLAALSLKSISVFTEGSLALSALTLTLSFGLIFSLWRWLRHAN